VSISGCNNSLDIDDVKILFITLGKVAFTASAGFQAMFGASTNFTFAYTGDAAVCHAYVAALDRDFGWKPTFTVFTFPFSGPFFPYPPFPYRSQSMSDDLDLPILFFLAG
jgi:hypothetical protein